MTATSAVEGPYILQFIHMQRFLLSLLVLGALATAPYAATAQPDSYSAPVTARTQFVFKDGAVMRRDGEDTSPLTQNVRLKNGTKINYKSGIVELATGKITTLREGDYVKSDGGIVFATPASAAAARGEKPAKVASTYRHGTCRSLAPSVGPGQQLNLLQQKVELLEEKIKLLNQGRQRPTPNPNTSLDALISSP